MRRVCCASVGGALSRADHRSARNGPSGRRRAGSPRICDPRADAGNGGLQLDERGICDVSAALRRVAPCRGRITDPPGTGRLAAAAVCSPRICDPRADAGNGGLQLDERGYATYLLRCGGWRLVAGGSQIRPERAVWPPPPLVPRGSVIRGRMRVTVACSLTSVGMRRVCCAAACGALSRADHRSARNGPSGRRRRLFPADL